MEGMDVAEQKALQRLIEEELQPQSPAVGECYDEGRQAAAGLAEGDFPEAGPIGLGLLAGEDLQTQEGFAVAWSQLSHPAAQLDQAALVTPGLEHLEQARGSQTRILLEGLTQEVQIGIGQPAAVRWAAEKAFGLQRPAHGVGVQAEFGRNGAHLPGARRGTSDGSEPSFSSNHGSFSRVKGLTHPPRRPQRQQHSGSEGSRPKPPRGGPRSKAASRGWAGAVILTEAVPGWEP